MTFGHFIKLMTTSQSVWVVHISLCITTVNKLSSEYKRKIQ